MEYDVCVIMPCYNAEATVEAAFRSVLSQSGISIQFIAVDDGSTDNTASVLRRLSLDAPDNIHVEIVSGGCNKGMAAAIASAMEIANARYFTQCDADDIILPDALRRMFNAGISENADLVAGVMRIADGKGNFFRGCPDSPYVLNNLTINTPNFSNHSKLISLRALRQHDIAPVEGLDRWEDLILLSKFLAHDPRVVIVDFEVYQYLYDNDKPSLSRSRKELTLRDHIAGACDVEKYFIKNGVNHKFEHFLNYLKFCAKVKFVRGSGRDVAQWKNTFPESNKHILSYRRIPLIYRLAFMAVDILPTSFSQAIFNLIDRITGRE